MAPVNPDITSRSNAPPLALFSAQTLVVVGLITNVVLTIRRAARALPPPTSTRIQQPLRRRNAVIFSALAVLSLAAVTTFSVAWRVLSYFEWADKGNHESPGTLWKGWYGTGAEEVGWRVGDWYSDVDLIEEADAVIMGAPEAFLYLYQHFCGIAAAAIFFGVEGRRRNLTIATIASFVALSEAASLGFALNMFFVTMLFTPVARHDDDTPRHDALFTPHSAVFCVPVIGSLLVLQYFPTLLAHRANITFFRIGYFVVPLFLAFAPQIVPVSWGHRHTSKASAHRSFVRAFYVLGLTSVLIHWKEFAKSLLVNTPPSRSTAYDLFTNALGKQQQKSNRLFTGLSNTAQKLKTVSTHPAISITGSDIAFTALGLLVWTFVRELDVNSVLENSILAFLAPQKTEKHVAFQDDVAQKIKEESPVLPSPRKRGRPRRNTANGAGSAPAEPASYSGSLRRSTRRKARQDFDSDAEDAYEPSTSTREAVKQTETDGSSPGEDLTAAGESTALALLLAFTGGIGQLAASVLGAETTGGD